MGVEYPGRAYESDAAGWGKGGVDGGAAAAEEADEERGGGREEDEGGAGGEEGWVGWWVSLCLCKWQARWKGLMGG